MKIDKVLTLLNKFFNEEEETNKRGNKIRRAYIGGDRYIFDFKICSPRDGWQQYDTSQDAWYFGVWIHPEGRVTITFAEGDLS
ncbi:hypothetical protein LCGC14_2584760, partial [marine sediment metagenome]